MILSENAVTYLFPLAIKVCEFILLLALKAAGQIWLLSNFDSQEDIAYPNDPRVPIKVDNDLKQLFLGIELPRDMIDIERSEEWDEACHQHCSEEGQVRGSRHVLQAQAKEEEARDHQEDKAD